MMGLKSIGGGGAAEKAARVLAEVDACIGKMHDCARALERVSGMQEFAEAFRVDANNLTKRRNVLRVKLGAR